MVIAGCVIQTNRIYVSNEFDFQANYKGKYINISNHHGFGRPKESYLTRFYIYVTDMKIGWYDVQTYGDFENINDAIAYALEGAMLTKKINA